MICKAEKYGRAVFVAVMFLLVCFVSGQAAAADVRLAWDPSEDNVAGYNVYYGTQSGAYTANVDAGNTTNYTLTGLEDGRTYYVATTAYLATGEESDYSNEITTASAPASSDSAPASSDSGGGGGGCFIATAAYGSYMAPEVQALRDFRDKWLMTNPAGRVFVSIYYKFSPPLADTIRGNEMLRAMSRWMLSPMVYAVKFPAASLLIVLLAMLGTVMGCRAAARRSCGQP